MQRRPLRIAIPLISLAILLPIVLLAQNGLFSHPRWPWSHLSRELTAARSRLSEIFGPGTAFPLKDARIVIHKAQRKADLFAGHRLIKTYKIALGPHPKEAKTKKGDGRTPEGTYHLVTRRHRTPYHLFLGLNYPCAQDAERALRETRITNDLAHEIQRAEGKHRKPSWNTQLGGAIGLHGAGNDGDWTLGCIAFSDADISELWVATTHWTPVEIRP